MNNNNQSTAKVSQTHRQLWAWVVLLIVILLTLVIRIRLVPVPFERDEGEYAYAGQLMLQGIPPYEKVYNMKMPGLYAAYAMLLVPFGPPYTGIHVGLIFLNLGAVIFIFLLARDLFDPLIGAVAGATYALLSASDSVLGFTANAEHFVVFPALAGIWLLRKALGSKKYFSFFGGGLLLGLAFMMKQHAAAFIVFASLYLIVSLLRSRPVNWKLFLHCSVLFIVGVFLPFLLTCLILWQCGVFSKFWFWTFAYARQYVSLVPLNVGLKILNMAAKQITTQSYLLWALAGIGLFYVFWSTRLRKQSLFVTAFLIFSFLSVCPGLYFRLHYFILFLPAVAVLASAGTIFVYDIFSSYRSIFMTKVLPTILVLSAFVHAIYRHWNYFFIASPQYICTHTYWPNPFNESLKIAEFISQNSQKNDTIAVVGSEPQIYFYSHRLSATGYVYTYPLMEPHPYASKMQDEMISQIEQANPKFLVLVHVHFSWIARDKSDQKIFNWADRFVAKSYHAVGVVDLISPGQTVFRWGSDAKQYIPKSLSWVAILRHNRYSNEILRSGINPVDDVN